MIWLHIKKREAPVQIKSVVGVGVNREEAKSRESARSSHLTRRGDGDIHFLRRKQGLKPVTWERLQWIKTDKQQSEPMSSSNMQYYEWNLHEVGGESEDPKAYKSHDTHFMKWTAAKTKIQTFGNINRSNKFIRRKASNGRGQRTAVDLEGTRHGNGLVGSPPVRRTVLSIFYFHLGHEFTGACYIIRNNQL